MSSASGNGRSAGRAGSRDRFPEAGAGLEVWPWDGDTGEVREALARGLVLAIPTESSYGLAVDPRSEAGVEAIYRLKRRERGKPLPVVVTDVEQAVGLGVEVNAAVRFAEAHWPAPLTVVAPLRAGASLPAAAGGSTLAIRVPAHERLRCLLGTLGHPLTATSANLSTEAPALSLEELEQVLPAGSGLVVGGGPTPGGMASTVVSSADAGLRVLRCGRFRLSAAAASCGEATES